MNFIRFIFAFLYVRNWHTGKRELSRERVTLFMGGLLITLIALTLIAFLQSPLYYAT